LLASALTSADQDRPRLVQGLLKLEGYEVLTGLLCQRP
jgi:hypothetical protein